MHPKYSQGEGERDLMSDLPDDIIHHIISFLGYNDAVRLGTLSKRFQQLCISSPYLYIEDWGFWGKQNFINFLSRLMQQRGGLRIVCFIWQCKFDCPKRYSMLLNLLHHFVAINNVQELVLDLDRGRLSESPLPLPTSWFDSQHLRALTIKWGNQFSLQNVTTSQVINNSLQFLSLEHIHDASNSVGDWISNSFPCLKRVVIKDNCYYHRNGYDLIIRNSSIEDLSISGEYFKHVKVTTEKLQSLSLDFDKCRVDEPYLVEITNSPNIKDLRWKGTPGKLRFIQRLMNMPRDATIDVKPRNGFFGSEHIYDASVCSSLRKVLQDLQSVRALHLSSWVIQLFSRHKCIPTGLSDVQHLSLVLMGGRAPRIAPFMKELKNIQVLHIRQYLTYEATTSSERKIKKLLRDWKPIQQLKEVEIDLKFNYIAIALLKHILKYAQDLEIVTVTCPSSYLDVLSSLVPTLEKASSKVKIHLRPETE